MPNPKSVRPQTIGDAIGTLNRRRNHLLTVLEEHPDWIYVLAEARAITTALLVLEDTRLKVEPEEIRAHVTRARKEAKLYPSNQLRLVDGLP